MTALLEPPVSGVFVCWILMALLVAMRDKTTGADGSWRFGVTAGEAKRCTHTTVYYQGCLLLRLTAFPQATDLGLLSVKYIFITSVS